MNIKSIKTYQAVPFQGSLHTFFSENKQAGMLNMEFKIIDMLGVSIKSPKDHVIVPFANICAISPAPEEQEKKSQPSEVAVLDKSKQAALQRRLSR